MSKVREQVRAGPVGYKALIKLQQRLDEQRGFQHSIQDVILELINREHPDIVAEARQEIESEGK